MYFATLLLRFVKLCIECSPAGLDQINEGNTDLPNLALDLLLALQTCPAACLLCSSSTSKNLLTDLSMLSSAVFSDDFDFDRVKPLLSAIPDNESDELIWDTVYSAVTESTPPPRLPSSEWPQSIKLAEANTFVITKHFHAV